MPVKWEKELLSSGSFFAHKTKKVTGFVSRDFAVFSRIAVAAADPAAVPAR